ncbi:MAG: o-succinylbenzoate synthase [Gemmatimonadota bacterium]
MTASPAPGPPLTIERAELRLVPLRLRERFEISSGGWQDRRILLLALHAGGRVGWGECVAAEDPGYSYETTETAWHVLTDFLLPRVVGREAAGPADVLAPVSWVRGHRMAKAAVEMAAWDLEAKRRGVSLCDLVGGGRRPVEVGVSVGLQPSDEALLERVRGYVAEGYRRIKLKIKPGRDVAMLEKVRAAFPDTPLMADANSAYTLADADRLAALDALDLLMIEQPLGPEDLRDHARLQARLRTPVCLDESIRSAGDAALALELGACRIVNIKPGRVGGFESARAIHDLCAAWGVPVWCGGMLESGIGRAHNVALATLPGFTLPGDISASARYWERDLVTPEFELADGTLILPDAPGIGVEPDVDRIETLATRRADFGG